MNIKELRESLVKSFNDLKVGKLKTKEAKELTNLAGKIILSSKVELDYNKFMRKDVPIEFLEVDQTPKAKRGRPKKDSN